MSALRKAGESTRLRYAKLALFALVVILGAMAINFWVVQDRHRFGLLGVGVSLVSLVVLKQANRFFDGVDRTWGDGARAEEKVGRVLAGLEEQGWLILHDLDTGRGNVDHVAVGPTGVFTLDTKSHRGRIEVDGSRLVRGGKPLEKDFLRQATAESLWLKERLADVGHDAFVTPVVCFTRAFVKVPKAATRPVRVVPLKWLVEELTRGKARFEGEDLERLQAAVREAVGHAPVEAVPTT